MEATLDDIDVYYVYSLIHGSDTYYQVLMWTLPENKTEFKTIVDNTINSFKEI